MGNLIGESVGEEILKYAHAQGFDLDSLESVEGFLREHGMGGEISIAECGVCPKSVGHYQFDGTACPWPGLLATVLLAIFRERLWPSARLVPAETCVIRLHGGDIGLCDCHRSREYRLEAALGGVDGIRRALGTDA